MSEGVREAGGNGVYLLADDAGNVWPFEDDMYATRAAQRLVHTPYYSVTWVPFGMSLAEAKRLPENNGVVT